MSRLVPLVEADARCGAKAEHLGRLARAGFAVPAGVVVVDATDDGWPDELEPVLRRLGGGPFAVRSSALGEDGCAASFAGLLRTALGVTGRDRVVDEVRRVARSGAEPQVAAYAARTGRSPLGAVPVLVQVLVRAEVAGVLFTRHPVTGADHVVVEAARGLGVDVVGGEVTPHRWVVEGGRVRADGGGRPAVLSPEQVLVLARTGRRVEAASGVPQDVEWALAGGTSWVLQARPITTAPPVLAPPPGQGGEVLLSGTPAGPGTAVGPVRVVHGLDDFGRFRGGDVLVCRTTSPAWTPLLARAAAVVTEVGGILSHAAVVAREFGIPAVTAADRATGLLRDGCEVVVDGGRGTLRASSVASRGGDRR